MVIIMPNIKPISELRNYTSVVGEVSYGSRVYLTKNGHGNITMIDMRELDEIEEELALYKFKYQMALAEKSIQEEGTISADELETELGV
jgi:PHD/YefM family antitoxin component YafN of YafNO toxin-antitoxin module